MSQALEGKDVKDLLSNIGSGGGAAAGPAAGAGGAAAADEPKAEEKEEGQSNISIPPPFPVGSLHLASPTTGLAPYLIPAASAKAITLREMLIVTTEKEESDDDMGFGLFD